MSALRYSGGVRIRLTLIDTLIDPQHPHGFAYRCSLTRTANEGTAFAKTVRARVLSHPAAERLQASADSPEAFDNAAIDAIGTAAMGDPDWSQAAALTINGSAVHVGRTSGAAWPKDPEAATSTCDHGPRAVTTCGTCGRSWCDACDPTPAAACHYCSGRGRSTAPRETLAAAPVPVWKASTFTPAIRDRAIAAHEKEKAAEAQGPIAFGPHRGREYPRADGMADGLTAADAPRTPPEGTPRILASNSHLVFAIVGDRPKGKS